MKHKKIGFLLPLFVLGGASLLSSCNKGEKVQLSFGSLSRKEDEKTYTNISYAQLSSKVSQKESFLLVVDPQGCACFSSFINCSKSYFTNHKMILYRITINELEAQTDKLGINYVSGSTSFVIFKDGVVHQNLISNKNEKQMSNKEEFENYISRVVDDPKMYLLTLDEMDTLYHTNQKSVVYFKRSNCSDCSYVEKDFLFSYMKTAKNNLYVLDCETIGIREYDQHGNLTPTSQIAWNNFKIKYGLAKEKNEKYGYDTGYVPSFYLIEGNQTSTTFLSGAVSYNDSITKQGDKFVVSNTYYSASRKQYLEYANKMEILEGYVVPNNEIETYDFGGVPYYSWKHENASKKHNQYLHAFLDDALAKETYHF